MHCIFTILQWRNTIFLQLIFNKYWLNSNICEELEIRDKEWRFSPFLLEKQEKNYFNEKKKARDFKIIKNH